MHRMLLGSPALRADALDHAGTWVLTRGGVLNVYGPITAADAHRIGAHRNVNLLQLVHGYTKASAPGQLRLFDEHVVVRHPRLDLRITLNGYGAFDDLAFLEHLPHLRGLRVDGGHALDLSPIRRFVALDSLGVGGLGTSLRPLEGYASLKDLFVHERIKDLETIGTLHNLRALTIGGKSPTDLGFLVPLRKLRSIAFQLVAPRRFADLCELPALTELRVWRARMLDARALTPINQIARLQKLVLSELPRITSLGWLRSKTLRTLVLDEMTGLRSVKALAGLPALRRLILDGKTVIRR